MAHDICHAYFYVMEWYLLFCLFIFLKRRIYVSFLFQVVPQDASKLAEFLKIIDSTSEFETALKEMKFISASENKDNQLSSFAENVEVHFASRKKTEILGKARNLLLQCDFAVSQVSSRMR